MRIRSIKPEFWESESLSRVSRDARLLFIGLFTCCDDCGRTRAATRLLASRLFPFDDVMGLIPGWLDELEGQGCIRLYTVDSERYLDIPKWRNHQKIDRPSASKIPAHPDDQKVIETLRHYQNAGKTDADSMPPREDSRGLASVPGNSPQIAKSGDPAPEGSRNVALEQGMGMGTGNGNREGEGDAPPPETPVELPAGFPKTLEAAVRHGMSVGAPEDFVRTEWHRAVGRGGKDSKGVTVLSWPHYLQTCWSAHRGRTSMPKGGSGSESEQKNVAPRIVTV